MLKLLIVEGNTAEQRRRHSEAGGRIAHVLYTDVLRQIRSDLSFDIAFPADGNSDLPSVAALTAFDGIVWTGSALNIYQGGAEIERQIAFSQSCFSAHVPQFGSCWGVQVAVVAAGGEIALNPEGREIGIARKIVLTEPGKVHALYRGKPPVFDALAVHKDGIATLPDGACVLSTNAMGIQALSIAFEGGELWGVQYHPEYHFGEVASCMRRYAPSLVEEGLFSCQAEVIGAASEFAAFDIAPSKRAQWCFGLEADTLEPSMRRRELINWLAFVAGDKG
jgi:GMP synthase (glutamine-hydrolysing)